MPLPKQRKTLLFANPAGEKLFGSGLIATYEAEDLLRPDRTGDPPDLSLLRDTLKDVVSSMRLEGRSHLDIREIKIYEELTKEPAKKQAGRSEETVGGAVDYGKKRLLVFSREGLRNPWVRYQMVAHSLQRRGSPGGNGAHNSRMVVKTIEAWFPAFEHSPRLDGRTPIWTRIHCDLEIHEGFARSRFFQSLSQADQRKRKKKHADLKEGRCQWAHLLTAPCECYRGGS